jgi:selenide,water dikinase
MPINQIPLDVIGQIIEGGESICREAGIPIAGGHSIDSVEPIYGLVVMGLIHPSKVKRNSGAQIGDQLILSKPLGVGILSAALKKQRLDAAGYASMIANTTKLNKPGQLLAQLEGVHAMTDVTGFGLLGHLLEICRGARISATINASNIPVLPQVQTLAAAGCVTGASARNFAAYGHDVILNSTDSVTQALLTDPQTSGGLLIACAKESVDEVLALLHSNHFAEATVIGEMIEGPAQIHVQ